MVFARVLSDFIGLLMFATDPEIKDEKLAYKIANENITHPFRYVKNSSFQRFICLLKNGSEEIKNHKEALKLLRNQLANSTKEESEIILTDLADLLLNGDQEVKDIKEAISTYEELLDSEFFDGYATYQLIDIYENNDAFKDLSKALEYSKRLVSLSHDQPNEHIIALRRLLSFFAENYLEAFDFEVAIKTAEEISNHPKVTEPIRLDVLVSLSKIHNKCPDKIILEKRHLVHDALVHHPLVSPIDRHDAFDRLIAVYRDQGELLKAKNTYEEHLLGATDWQQPYVLNNYIGFLQIQPEDSVAYDNIRLDQLITQLEAINNLTEESNNNILVQLPGIVPGFGGQVPVDPYFSLAIIKNRTTSLQNLSEDSFDKLTYRTTLNKAKEEIGITIESYRLKAKDHHETAQKAKEVFQLGNSHHYSYPSIINDLDYRFSYNEKTMAFGEILVRIWNRIDNLKPEDKEYAKDFIVVQLASAVDPDGHIVCPIGKLTRLLQVLETYCADIHVTTLSLEDIATGYFKVKAKAFESLPKNHSLKILEEKSLESSKKPFKEIIIEDISYQYPWIQEKKHRDTFNHLEKSEQITIDEYYKELTEGLEAELLKSRDKLTETEGELVRKQVSSYIAFTFL